MAIFRCSKCGHLRETGNDYIGKSVKCPKCTNPTTIYGTVAFIEALIKKYFIQGEELQNLRTKLPVDSCNLDLLAEKLTLDEVDINNTNIYTKKENFEPIIEWFGKRNIHIQINSNALDTTGFFDDIALIMGNNYSTLKLITNQIKYIQNNGYSNVKIDLSKKNKEEAQQIISFCKTLYDYSFVVKYYYQKNEEIIRLVLQSAPNIRNFFNGMWMEWFAFMKLLKFFKKQGIYPSCTRNLNISFPGGNANELDIFFLMEDKTPVCVECKSGEFRHDINKYLSLRKKLKIEKNNFIICVFGLGLEQAQGMTSMYDLTFVNEVTIIDHIQTVV